MNSLECLTGRGQSYQMTNDQQECENVPNTQFHSCEAGMHSLVKPASQ